jgi:hypothetical protein
MVIGSKDVAVAFPSYVMYGRAEFVTGIRDRNSLPDGIRDQTGIRDQEFVTRNS